MSDERAGMLNEPDLVDDIVKLSIEYVSKTGDDDDSTVAASTILAAFHVMTKRGLLNELGVEQVHRSMKLYGMRQ